MKLPGPKFSSQTKDRLINTEVEGLVQTHFAKLLPNGWKKLKAAKQLVKRSLLRSKPVRRLARPVNWPARIAKAFRRGGMPDKLRDCQTREVDRAMFLVEGDSAGVCQAGLDADFLPFYR